MVAGVDVEVWCSQDSRGYAKAGSAWAVANLIGDTGVEFHDVTVKAGETTVDTWLNKEQGLVWFYKKTKPRL